MKKLHLKSFYIAGFSYYDGAFAFNQLSIGSKVKIKLDKKNKHDENAVELLYGDYKLGYIPRNENLEIAKMLQMGHNVFEGVVQQLSPEVHPAQKN